MSSNHEIEVKILNVNVDQLTEQLKMLGATFEFSKLTISILFDTPTLALRSKRKTLRLRSIGSQAYLTSKSLATDQLDSSVKVRVENEVEVSNFGTMRLILEQAGFEEKLIIEKHRTQYRLEDTVFDIDIHMGKHSCIPPLLEIEAKSSDIIFSYAARLGFTLEQCKNWGLTELLEYYMRTPNNKCSECVYYRWVVSYSNLYDYYCEATKQMVFGDHQCCDQFERP
jgi:predicted adenylyl cyclase CyaB